MSEHEIVGKLIRSAGNINPHPEPEQACYEVTESRAACLVPVVVLKIFIRSISPSGPDKANEAPPAADVEPLFRFELQ